MHFLDFLLSLLDLASDHAALDGLMILHTESGEPARHALTAVNTHEGILQREIKSRRAGIALPAGAATELIVNSPAVVSLGADDMQAAHLGDFPALFLHFFFSFNLFDGPLPNIFRHF